jgi:hypothetical protein
MLSSPGHLCINNCHPSPASASLVLARQSARLSPKIGTGYQQVPNGYQGQACTVEMWHCYLQLQDLTTADESQKSFTNR